MVLFIIIVAIAAVLFFLRSRIRVAKRGTLAQLTQQLGKLEQQDNDPNAFLGFCTRDEDALYFVYQDGVFYLDYELSTEAKKSHADAFRKTAADLGLPVIDTSYSGRFPLLRVKTGNLAVEATGVALRFARQLFGHDRNTVFEILP